MDSGIRWLAPWTKFTYPGIERTGEQVIGTGRRTIWKWRTGDRRPPPHMVERLAAEIERRLDEGQAILAELRRYVADWRPYDRSVPHFMRIDPETGQDRRFRG